MNHQNSCQVQCFTPEYSWQDVGAPLATIEKAKAIIASARKQTSVVLRVRTILPTPSPMVNEFAP